MSGNSKRTSEAPDFFQLVRRLEQSAEQPGGVRGRRGMLGFDVDPDGEIARFRVEANLCFPPVAARRTEPRRSELASGPAEISISFLGAIGATGVLPFHYTELALQRLAMHDPAMVEFLDLFHHRSASFFYRAWRKYRLPFAFERARARGKDENDPTRIFLSLVGLGTDRLTDRLAERDASWVCYAAHFARRTRSAHGLEVMLEDFVGCPVQVDQFVGRWKPLLEDARTKLSSRRDGSGQHDRLGVSAVLGDRVWDLQSDIRIRIGPIGAQSLRHLLKDSGPANVLVPLVRSYLDGAASFEITGHVDRATIRPCILGDDGTASAPLGRSCWLDASSAAAYEAEVPIWLDN